MKNSQGEITRESRHCLADSTNLRCTFRNMAFIIDFCAEKDRHVSSSKEIEHLKIKKVFGRIVTTSGMQFLDDHNYA